jgi:hypothetical protein
MGIKAGVKIAMFLQTNEETVGKAVALQVKNYLVIFKNTQK